MAFLSASWKNLIMANYSVDPDVLRPFVPEHTELDLWNNTCYVSLVGFLFVDTRLKGIKIPFHVDFEEINLRFYVRRFTGGEWRRGVVFIKEIVSKPALSFVANTLYGEHYETMPTAHSIRKESPRFSMEYRWKKGAKWNRLGAIASMETMEIAAGSEEEFITEHYWGYAKIDENRTTEYAVQHPRWRIYPLTSYTIDVDFAAVYGPEFGFLNNEIPVSVFMAQGSEISVFKGLRL